MTFQFSWTLKFLYRFQTFFSYDHQPRQTELPPAYTWISVVASHLISPHPISPLQSFFHNGARMIFIKRLIVLVTLLPNSLGDLPLTLRLKTKNVNMAYEGLHGLILNFHSSFISKCAPTCSQCSCKTGFLSFLQCAISLLPRAQTSR